MYATMVGALILAWAVNEACANWKQITRVENVCCRCYIRAGRNGRKKMRIGPQAILRNKKIDYCVQILAQSILAVILTPFILLGILISSVKKVSELEWKEK
jgi:hypothetical protein